MTTVIGGSGETIQLQLGDLIRIVSPKDPTYNSHIFFIYYIDSNKIKLINVDDLSNHVLTIAESGALDNTAIETIELLDRAATPSYAQQNGLTTDKWIDITFSGETPFIVTGEIINTQEDMIEIRTYPNKEVIYINFDYKGVPDYIQYIEIRPPPYAEDAADADEELANKKEEEETLEDNAAATATAAAAPQEDQAPTQGRVYLDADNIHIGTVELAPVVQYVNVGDIAHRFSLEAQITDLLDNMLSTIPTVDRTPAVMKDIHATITGFKYLRERYSHFDENRNIIRPIIKTDADKPLYDWFINGMSIKLPWIVPVVKEQKKYYIDDEAAAAAAATIDTTYILPLSFSQTLADMENLYQLFKTNNATTEGVIASNSNKISQFYQQYDPYTIPYDTTADLEQDTIQHLTFRPESYNNIYTIMNNNGDFTITDIKNNSVPFFGQVATRGLDHIVSKYVMAGSRKQVTERAPMTLNDSIDIHAFMTMPVPYIQHTTAYLPGASSTIYDISIKSQPDIQNAIAFYTKFETAPTIDTYNVPTASDAAQADPQLERPFVTQSRISNFQPDKQPLYKQNFSTQYPTYINRLVPRNRAIFNRFRSYVNHSKGISYVAIVDQLEPFLIYRDDVTHTMYEDLMKYITQSAAQYIKTTADNVKTLLTIAKYGSAVPIPKTRHFPAIFDVLSNQPAREAVIADYNLAEYLETGERGGYLCTNSEIYMKLTRADCAQYYNAVCALQNMSLVIPDTVIRLLEGDTAEADHNNRAADCKDIVIAKTYTTEGDLINDNGNPNIYFDAKSDTTNYSILDDFEKQIATMTSGDFMTFLIGKLKTGFKLSETNAAYMAETLIAGQKRVIDGQYAVIADKERGRELEYYIRKSNQWVKVAEPPINGIAATDPAILCDVQDQCISTPATKKFKHGREQITYTDDTCTPMQTTKKEHHARLLKQLVAEFDTTFVKSVEDLRTQLEHRVKYCQKILPVIHRIHVDRALMYNRQKELIVKGAHMAAAGAENGETQQQQQQLRTYSPFERGWQQVLAEPDFMTKQYYIVKFVNQFTRRAYPSAPAETPHWFYCNQTGAPLVPAFLYTLANVFIETPTQYETQTDLIIAKIGKLSDDGNMWVDMYSGYPIKMISASTDEGFDAEGHRIVTKGELDEVAGGGTTAPPLPQATNPESIANLTKILPTDSLPIKYIKTIINYLLGTLGITLPTHQIQFIIETTIPLFETHLPNETDYNRAYKIMISKPGLTKKPPTYEDIYNNLILYLTLGTLFVAIQTAVPPVSTRKTFPTCTRSFGGYPFDGEGDLSGINYLACILAKIKNISPPWTILPKKEKTIADKIKEHIEKYIISVPAVKLQLEQKAQYLETHAADVEDQLAEYNVSARWPTFLPPLVPFKLSPTPEPIGPHFRTELLSDMKRAGANITPKLLILQSKTMQFAFAVQQSIQSVVSDNDALLHKSTNEPYLENACCINTTYNTSTVAYFTHKRPDIIKSNALVKEYAAILYDIREYAKAPQLWCPLNDRVIYEPIPAVYSETTIYNAFITFCNFRNYQPIPAPYVAFCTAGKPANIHAGDTLNEMIVKLKNDGVHYTYDALQQFLQAVAHMHTINIVPDIIITPERQLLSHLSILENAIHVDSMPPAAAKDKLRLIDLVKGALIEATQEGNTVADMNTSALNNYLLESTATLKTRIGAFMKQYLSNKTMRAVTQFLAGFANWKVASDDLDMTLITSNVGNRADALCVFMKNIGITFPQMLLNGAMHTDDAIPAHWELAESHVKMLQEMVRKQWAPLAVAAKYTTTRLLETIQTVARPLVNLADKTQNIFITHRTGTYLGEYFILRTFIDYIELSDRADMLVSERTITRVEDVMADYDNTGLIMFEPVEVDTNAMVYQGSLKTLREHTAQILSAYIEIFMSQKDLVDLSVADIQEIVYRTQEAERKGVTDRLEAMTVEERAAENMMKQYKLGEIWGMGLQKALVEYVPSMYEKQRGFVDEMINAEMQARALLSGAGSGGPSATDDGEDVARAERSRDYDLDEAALRENTMPGDDMDDFGDDNDYANLDGEDYAGGDDGDW